MQAVARLAGSRLLRPFLAGPQGTAPAPLSATAVILPRWFSTTSPEGGPDSHDDFKPQYRAPDEALSVHESIEKDIQDNPVMVYMKGVPEAPQCGFSAMVVRILDHYGVPYKSQNVLADEELRQGIKSYSQWPTIPQVYIKGEFVGGCDILMDMQKTGQLKLKLDEVKGKVSA